MSHGHRSSNARHARHLHRDPGFGGPLFCALYFRALCLRVVHGRYRLAASKRVTAKASPSRRAPHYAVRDRGRAHRVHLHGRLGVQRRRPMDDRQCRAVPGHVCALDGLARRARHFYRRIGRRALRRDVAGAARSDHCRAHQQYRRLRHPRFRVHDARAARSAATCGSGSRR